MSGHSKWSDIKRRKGLTDPRHLARQASRGMIARGERPLYRPRLEPDGGFILIRIPELELVTEARHRREVVAVARDLIALWLDVPADSFDIEVDEAQLT
jgi:hypothetical protein